MESVTIQEFTAPNGKGWIFKHKGKDIAEVDKVKGERGYRVYDLPVLVDRWSSKSKAIEVAKDIVREKFSGLEVKFKESVVIVHWK